MQKITTIFVCLMISACNSSRPDSPFPVPNGARDVHHWLSPDSVVSETMFLISSQKNSVKYIEEIERKILERTYLRCDAGSGFWEIKAQRDDKPVVRMVRFYRDALSKKLVTLSGEQACSDKNNDCDQTYSISFRDLSSANMAEFIKEICSK